MNISKTLFVFFISILLIVSTVYAFDVSSQTQGISLCPRATELFVDTIKNDDNLVRNFYISLDGAASDWGIITENNFILNAGEEKKIYTYITPPGNADEGKYGLKIKITSGDDTREINHIVKIKDCFGVSLSGGARVKNTCPNEVVTYNVNVLNSGEFSGDFDFSVSGEISNTVSLNHESLRLDSGESKPLTIFVNSPVNAGKYDFNLNIESGRVSRSVDFELDVDPCYGYELSVRGDNFVSLCEHSSMTTPLNLKNDGTVSNKFNVEINEGPVWARLSSSEISLGKGEAKTFLLAVAPDFGVSGNYTVEVTALPELGNLKAVTNLGIQVRKCHSVDVDIGVDSDTICKGDTNFYSVNIENDGEFDKRYNITLNGPPWVSLVSEEVISLNARKGISAALIAKPDLEVEDKEFEITVRAETLDDSKKSDEEKILLNVKEVGDCFETGLGLDYENIVVHFDSGLLIPLHVKNNGLEDTTYEIILLGNALDFSNLAEDSFVLEAGVDKTIYLYVAPTIDTGLGHYSLDLEFYTNGLFLENKHIDIEVTDDLSRITVINDEKVSNLSKVKDFVHTYRYYLIGGVIVIILIILALIFGRKTIEFFDEEEIKKEVKDIEKKKDKK